MPTLRSYGPPRYRDAYSFRGLGRPIAQRAAPSPRHGILEPTEPPHDANTVDPDEPRG